MDPKGVPLLPTSEATGGAGVWGLLAVAASAICFSMMGAGVLLVAEAFTASQTMLVRCIIQTALSLGYLISNGHPLLGAPGIRRWVLLRGFVGSVGQWILFYSVTQIPLGDANAILFVNPIFTAVLSCLLYGEPLRLMELVALVLSITGVMLVSRPPALFGGEGRGEQPQGRAPRQLVVALCLVGALAIGSIFIIVRRVGKAAHWMALVMVTSASGAALSVLLLALGVEEAHWPVPAEVGWRPYAGQLCIGLIASLGQSLFNLGLQLERQPALAAITRQLDVPFAFLWQVAIFGEAPSGLSLLGSCLVVAGTTTVLGRKMACRSGGGRASAASSPK